MQHIPSMTEKLDPFSEAFLKTCYREDVPVDTAYLMLVKAATNNARQSALLPVGDIGRAVLFQHGRRVADLVSE